MSLDPGTYYEKQWSNIRNTEVSPSSITLMIIQGRCVLLEKPMPLMGKKSAECVAPIKLSPNSNTIVVLVVQHTNAAICSELNVL